MYLQVLVSLIAVVAIGARAADVAPGLAGLVSYSMPRFPGGLRGVMEGDGEVVMAITIDAQGRVDDSIELLATNDSFAHAASIAVSDWQFTPTAAASWPRREIVEFNFKRSGVVTSLSHAEAASEGFAITGNAKIKTLQWHQLDSEPQRISARMPTISKAILDKRGKQPLLINFVIDKQGRVRVPVVPATEDPHLAQTVLDVVREWRYSPPQHQNEPVSVEVTRALILTGAAPD